MKELLWPIINFVILLSAAFWQGIPRLKKYFKSHSKKIAGDYANATRNYNQARQDFEEMAKRNQNIAEEEKRIFEEIHHEKDHLEKKHVEDMKTLAASLELEIKRDFEGEKNRGQKKLLEELLDSVLSRAANVVGEDKNLKDKASETLLEKL